MFDFDDFWMWVDEGKVQDLDVEQDADLSSALFLEQAAHCFICMSPPMVRKYAFHMILAGHRFNKAGQVSGQRVCVCVCVHAFMAVS